MKYRRKASRWRALTLAELMITIVLVSVVFLTIGAISVFFINHISEVTDRYNINALINYALEDLKIRSISAIDIKDDSVFRTGESKQQFTFRGEKDVYRITPDNLDDTVWYTYRVDDAGNLILETTDTGNTVTETLIDKKYKPKITFTHVEGTEPNFLRVILVSGNERIGAEPLKKIEGLRFWFIGVVR